MKRRDVLKVFSAGAVTAMAGHLRLESGAHKLPATTYEDFAVEPVELVTDSNYYLESAAPVLDEYIEAFRARQGTTTNSSQANLKDYIAKMKSFDATHADDVFLAPERYRLLLSTYRRMDRVQNLVGHGNFNVLSFDEMRRFSARYDSVGSFSPDELGFLEEIFFSSAEQYGFFGEKVIDELTATVPERDRFKVPYTGHYIYRGDSLQSYQRVRQTIGDTIILTSGIRSVVKQTHLFLAKTIQARGNLSRASRSLAPPGHSYHGIGDYDVGKVGFGRRNFTEDFARTGEFQRLVDLGYISMRYPEGNLLGVRFEPWHIKVV